VIDALPHGFPQDMTESIYNGVVHRVRLIDTFLTGDLNPDDG
jgi:serine/threonine-protein kinase HipA